MSQFQQPAISSPEDKFVAGNHKGHLLLFFPTKFQAQVATAHGESDAVGTKIVDLDTGQVLENALIFATALVTQLKDAVPDGMVLGRLGQGENTKGNPPWLLSPHNAQEIAVAEAYLAANPRNQFAQPQTAPPTPPAYTAPATVAAPAWGGQGNAAAAGVAPAPASSAGASWGAPAPVAAPAPTVVADPVDPGLAAALGAKGYPVPPTHTAALALWAVVGG